MNKFISIASAVALAGMVSFAAAAPSAAGPYNNGLAAGVLGFVAGAAVASSVHPYYPYYPHHHYVDQGYYNGPDYHDHIAACYASYHSYDVHTDTYLGFDGYRHQCDL